MIKISYDALRYIKSPSYNAEIIAIKNNESAVRFVNNLNKEKILNFFKENILVIKYISKSVLKEIPKEEIKEALKEVLSKDDIEEKYVRDFINYNSIDYNEIMPNDKIIFIYKNGSKKAKKIAVDEKLKMI